MGAVIIITFVYLLGYVFRYLLFRRHMTIKCGWTKGDRNFNLFFSLFSWVWVATGLGVILIERMTGNSEEASW